MQSERMVQMQGLSVVEVIVALFLIGVIGAAGWTVMSQEPRASASQVGLFLGDTRNRAVLDGIDSGAFGPCGGGLIERMVGLKVEFPSRGLLFTPDGLPRTCDGGGVGNTTILLEHRGRQAAVIVSSLGRVRWELR